MQLRDGSFDFVAVAHRFTSPVPRTPDYMNATTTFSRFLAVELIRFTGPYCEAFEARVVATPRALKGVPAEAQEGPVRRRGQREDRLRTAVFPRE